MPSLRVLRTILSLAAACAVAVGCGTGDESGALSAGSTPGTVSTGGDGGAGPVALSTPVWYVIADAGGGSGGNDRLYSVDITLPVPQNNQTAIGGGTGTSNIEGAAFWPGTDTLYAFDNDRLGTINLTTGSWTQVVNRDVWDDGNTARLVGLDANRNPETQDRRVLSDIDSVSFDPNTGIAYGVARVSGADILFIFSEVTGRIVRGAFQIGATTYDYFRVPPVEPGNTDIDDIAIDPYDGQLYGIANGGGRADRLVRINKFDGTSSDVGLLGVEDMEGFAFYNDSSMWGVTGSGSNNAPDGSSNDNAVFSINRVTGQAFDRRPLTVGGSDFESMAFLTADLNEFCGRVWCDDNGNGTQDAGELGVANVTLVLWRDVADNDLLDADADIPLVSTTTDANGDYCFGVASTGDYVITVKTDTLPPDFVLSQADVLDVSVTGFGNTVNGLDFIKVGAVGTLGDVIFLDRDGDGVQDIIDPGLRGITVNLVDPGGDGICGTPDDVQLQSTVTDGGGYYTFRNLADGSYCVDVDETTLPPSSTLTTGNEPYAATIAAGSNDLGGDFGYQFPARIGDLVWLDMDGNGVADPGEPGLSGVTVTLTAPGPDGYLGTADDVTVATTVTDADGNYEFPGLTPGAYAVTVDEGTTPGGTTRTTFANPIRGFLRQGRFFDEADFGYRGDVAIGDRVWNDLDGDGNEDAGEPGLAGVTVTLVEAGPDGTFGTADDVTFPDQVTAADGSYSFVGLIAGTYRVEVDETTLPAGTRTSTTANNPTDAVLAQGETRTDIDFGYKANDASIGDRIWDDLDGDGVDDPGEPGLAGVQVDLLAPGPDGVFGTGDDVTIGSRTSAADGSYDFTALPPGTYRLDVVEATLPAGFGLTTGNEPLDIVLAGSEDFDDGDFGFWNPGSIGDRIFDDLDGDGTQDAGEPGIGGIDVDLIGPGPDGTLGTADDVVLLGTTTLADGSYGFANLAPGSYRVAVDGGTLPPGFVLTTGNEPFDKVLVAGEVFVDADFGYWRPGTLGDRVFDDRNGNGTEDAGEPGLAGVVVNLIEAGPDGTLGTADDVAAGSDTTDATGAYAFPGLPAGIYRVDVDQGSVPAGFTLTTSNDPTDVTLPVGASDNTIDFGFWRPSSIGDRVWNDADGDGVQDPGETGLNGVNVDLVEAGPDGTLGTPDDVAVGTLTTSGDGDYAFTALPPGTYRVSVDAGTLPPGVVLTGGTDPTDLVLNPGDARTDVDFGFRDNGTIGDLVWDDLDGDGMPDPGEPGIPGVTVRLAGAGPDGVCGTPDDVDLGSTTTSATGAYSFDALPGGTYCVMVDGTTVPGGYVPTSGVGTQMVTLPPGGTVNDTDFGYRQVAAIGDRVWQDLNADGVQDAGEPGLVGVRVDLVEAGPDGTFGTADDVTFPPETTAADGAYLFSGLFAGDYRVTVDGSTLPPGLALTSGNLPYDTTLAAGAGDANADFGYQYPSVIEGSVWQDIDEDATIDGGEPGIVGAVVDLFEAGPDGILGTPDDVLISTDSTVGPDGDYRFDFVPPGTYRVLVRPASVPAGMTLTTANQPFDTTIPTTPTTRRADFGYQFDGRIGDRVFLDADADGVEDPGEDGIGGVDLELREAGPDGVLGTGDDIGFPPATTAADGTYAFTQLPPGIYRVTPVGATLPPGTALSTASGTIDITLAPSGDDDTADFGYRYTGVIGDRVWRDTDGDGVEDAGEPGISNIDLDLITAGPDGTFGTPDDVTVASTTTALDGSYGFPNLGPGTYRVAVDTGTLEAGLQSTNGGPTQDVPLAAGEVLTTADFGFQFASSIGDRVWQDDDFDGVQDAGEPGLVGVQVDLAEAGPDGVLGTGDDVVVGSTTTAADGAYRFDFLPPGLYRVTVPGSGLPPGFASTTGNLPFDQTLGTAQVVDTADFGYQLTSSLGDRVWNDLDGDGVQDPGEPGLNGVTVDVFSPGPDGTLGTADDVLVGSPLTSGDGDWTLGGLPPGPYRVAVDGSTLPAGMVNTTGNDPADVVLPVATTLDDVDFGFRFAGSIGDRVWQDDDFDGVQDPGEPGLVGVDVTLVEAGPDGVFGTGDDVSGGTIVTGADGAYTFDALAPGTYRVDVPGPGLPAGFVSTTGNVPFDQVLAAAQVVDTVDFGFQNTSTLGDRVWNDLDGDGVQDPGEPGLNGVTVEVFAPGPDGTFGTADDVLVGSPATSGDGDWTLAGLPPGPYRVRVDVATLPAGMNNTTGNLPSDVTLPPATTLDDVDFGFRFAGSIGDRVWQDVDFDGVQDPGEPGLVGVEVTLVEAGPDGTLGTADDVSVGTTTTTVDGAYAFTALPPGTYRVDVPGTGVPAGMLLTTGNRPLDLTLAPAGTVTTADFGFQFAGTIGDRVWDDLDRDGVQDAGEPGLSGVRLDLVEAGTDGTFGTADDVAVGFQTTDGTGAYDFTALPPGLYRVDVVEATLPANYALTGGPEPRDVTLGGGADVDDADFGYALNTFEIGDDIFIDSNRNGVFDPALGEVAVPGVSVTLRDGSGAVVATTTTDANGEYRFTVTPGPYTVEVDAANFATGGPLEGQSSTGGGTTQSTTITAGDDFTLDFGFVAAQGTTSRNICQWWTTNTSQWPVTTLTIGGQTLNQTQLLEILNRGNLLAAGTRGRTAARVASQQDMSIFVAWALVGAKLNVAAGSDPTPVDATIQAADAYLAAVGIGSGIGRTHPRYREGQALCETLTAWNGGN